MDPSHEKPTRRLVAHFAHRLIALGKTLGNTLEKTLGGKSRPERIDIRVASLCGAASPLINRHLLDAFETHSRREAHVRIRPLNETIEYDPADPEQNDFSKASQEVRDHLSNTNADLLIWGEAAPAGTTMILRFLAAVPVEVDRLGYVDAETELHLPVDFDETLANLLFAFSIVATPTNTPKKTQALNGLIPGIVNSILEAIQNLPKGLTSRERASIQFCTGNTLAYLATHQKIIPFYQHAVALYQTVLTTLTATEQPVDWARTQLNLAACLQAIAERTEDPETIHAGVVACEAAIEIFNQDIQGQKPHKFLLAVAQNSLGFLLHKIDLQSGDTEMLKKSLNAFQAALKIFSRNETPRLWADTMSNFAQVALVLGEQMHRPDVLSKAIDACIATLDIRRQKDNPLLWAATQNNLGSALFLYGKMTNETGPLESALAAFNQALDIYEKHGAKRRAGVTAKNRDHVRRLIDKGTV